MSAPKKNVSMIGGREVRVLSIGGGKWSIGKGTK